MSAMMDLLDVSGNWVWPKYRTPLVVTNHGSHLYGTATHSSDRDIYCVMARTPDATARHSQARVQGTLKTIANGVDITMIDVGTWLDECVRGVPQALEAMFATDPEMDRLPTLRHGYRVGTSVWPTYLRTIKAFAHSDAVDPDGEPDRRNFKRHVHALRLAWNFHEMRSTGRFNPTLHPMQVEQYRSVVDRMDGDTEHLYAVCMAVAWK